MHSGRSGGDWSHGFKAIRGNGKERGLHDHLEDREHGHELGSENGRWEILTMENQEKSVGRYMSTTELMNVLNISRSTVYRLMIKGMPNIMVGSVHRFPMEKVLTWLKGLHTGTTKK